MPITFTYSSWYIKIIYAMLFVLDVVFIKNMKLHLDEKLVDCKLQENQGAS